MIVIPETQLEEFIHFLRMKCSVTQVMRFSPVNEEGEVFRAQSGSYMVFGKQADSHVHVLTDAEFETQISNLWLTRGQDR